MKKIILIGIILVLLLVGISLVYYSQTSSNVIGGYRLCPWVFKTKESYTGYAMGEIDYLWYRNAYKVSVMIPSFDPKDKPDTYHPFGPFKLKNGYIYYQGLCNKITAKKTAVFKNNIRSGEYNRDTLYQYVVEENPFTELYFCRNNYISNLQDITQNNQLDSFCEKII